MQTATPRKPFPNPGAYSRQFGMPSARTFDIPAIRMFIERHIEGARIILDPFCGQSLIGTHRGDVDPEALGLKVEAREWMAGLIASGFIADVILFDPPYSPRQITEHYKALGRTCGRGDTQNGKLYAECRAAFERLTVPGSVVLSFGWNSQGMGKTWARLETMLCHHGGAHNDTICVADLKP